MDENAWSFHKIQAFYEYVLKERESLRVTDDVLRQCWTLLQVVTSLNDLSPSSLNLQSLLSNSNVQSLCLEQHEFWPRLGATLLNAAPSHYVADLMAQLVDRIYDSGSLMHHELLEKIWEKRGDLKLSMKALEQILKTHPSLLEASLSKLLLKEDDCLSAKALWSQPRHSAIVRLAAESPEVFQAATSIMNEILIQTNLTAHIVELIRMFIKGVRSVHKADLNAFVSLYPLHVQFLVMFLSTKRWHASKSESEKLNNFVHLKLKELLKDDVKGFLCLAMHFPASNDTFQTFKS